MTKDCLNCSKPVEQVPGKRAKLYCGALCKSNYFKKKMDNLISKYSNIELKSEYDMVSISRVEYDRLKSAEFELNIIKTLEKQGEKKISFVPEGIKISTTIPESYDSAKVNRAFLDEFGQWEDNTKQKKINGKDEAKNKLKNDLRNVQINGEPIHLQKPIKIKGLNQLPKFDVVKPDRLPGESAIDWKIRCAQS